MKTHLRTIILIIAAGCLFAFTACEKEGPVGPAGAQGEQGIAGKKGDRGAAGPRGESGETGPRGERGQEELPGPADLSGLVVRKVRRELPM